MKRDPNAPRKPMRRTSSKRATKSKGAPCPKCGHGQNGGHNGRSCLHWVAPTYPGSFFVPDDDGGDYCGCKYVGRSAKTVASKAVAPKSDRKPVKHRNQKRRPSHQASAQREHTVIERAGGRCEFRHVVATAEDVHGELIEYTAPCGSRDRVQTVHLARRWKSPAPLKGEPAPVYSDAAAFAGCVVCHDKYDGRRPGREMVRIPEEYREAAFLEIRYSEVKRILAGRACAPVDLSELLPAGEHTIDNQYALLDAAREGRNHV
jgi:hypothetical protein